MHFHVSWWEGTQGAIDIHVVSGGMSSDLFERTSDSRANPTGAEEKHCGCGP